MIHVGDMYTGDAPQSPILRVIDGGKMDIKMHENRRIKVNDFFKEKFSDEFLDEIEVEYTLAQIAGRAFSAKEKSGLSFRKIAKKMGLRSPAMIQRIVQKAKPHNVTLATIVKFGQACGFDVDIEFKPRGDVPGAVPVSEESDE